MSWKKNLCLKESEGNKCSVSPGSVLFIPANATSKVTCSQVNQQQWNGKQLNKLRITKYIFQGSEKGLVLFQAYAGV